MKQTDLNPPQTSLLDSRQTLSLYLETLFREDHQEQEANIKNELIDQEEFEVMIVTIGIHKLALPVTDLLNVIELGNEALTKLPEQKPYSVGFFNRQGKNIPVYDINWVFNSSGRLQAPSLSSNEEGFRHIIVLEGERMALACNEVSEIITIKPDQVSWSKSKAHQSWLKGVITDDMTVLLSIRDIKRLFNRGISAKE